MGSNDSKKEVKKISIKLSNKGLFIQNYTLNHKSKHGSKIVTGRVQNKSSKIPIKKLIRQEIVKANKI